MHLINEKKVSWFFEHERESFYIERESVGGEKFSNTGTTIQTFLPCALEQGEFLVDLESWDTVFRKLLLRSKFLQKTSH